MLRCIIIYILVVCVFRLMGKRQIGEMQPFELVITLIVADLATMPMADTKIPLVHGLVPLITLLTLHFTLSVLSRKSIALRKLLSGKPVIIISPDGVQYDALKSLNMNMNDVFEGLRGCNFFELSEILYAIVETNGSLTVLPKALYGPVTCEAMKINNSPENELPLMLVCDGKIIKENLIVANVNEAFVLNQLKKVKLTDIKNILVLTLNKSGKLYIQPKNGKYVELNCEYSGGANW